MCLKPIKIRNPTKRIYRLGGQKLRMDVPCGQCAECKKEKRLEWLFRAYHHVNSLLNKGGYVYFDTLTYNDNNVPKLSHFIDISKYGCHDFTCFNMQHWRNFLKNLRRQIAYHYNDVKFTYFLVSEYGTDARYTHRPHYHVLFYVEDRRLHPLDFSRLVSKCWPYGITDGIKYKPLPHVSEHVYGYDLGFGNNSDKCSILSVCNYVSKYVTKDSTFQKTIDKRMKYLSLKIDDTQFLKDLFRNVDMYHKQSQGFGLSYLSTLSSKDIENLACKSICRLPSSKNVITFLKLPMYYVRHLFYKLKRREDKTYYWELTEDGKKYAIQKMLSSVEKVHDRYVQIYLNANNADRTFIDKLLHNRDLYDFVNYKLFYQGRLRYNSSVSFRNHTSNSRMDDVEYNLYDWLQIINGSYDINKCHQSLYFDNIENNVLIPKHGFVSDIFEHLTTEFSTYDYATFIDRFTFNERSDIIFKDFDKLDKYLISIMKVPNEQLQITFDFIEDLKIRIKQIYK